VIRAYRPDDLDRLYEICVRTGDAGQDAFDLVADKKLYGHIWAAQYGMFEPEHAFVVCDKDDRACGYVLGVLDTKAFEARLDAEYWPALQAQYPEGSGEGLDALLIGLINHPSHMPSSITDEYPSHLHVDLLPPFQGGGWGRKLMDTVIDSLRADGSVGLHFGVSAKNTRALGFYAHLGFEELHVSPSIHLLGTRF
jgi:ribosomal protein S18 acetylase RimI-like enzyme